MDDVLLTEAERVWLCRCGNEGTDFHTCPFQEEIYDDDWSMCNCCVECEHQCAMDV